MNRSEPVQRVRAFGQGSQPRARAALHRISAAPQPRLGPETVEKAKDGVQASVGEDEVGVDPRNLATRAGRSRRRKLPNPRLSISEPELRDSAVALNTISEPRAISFAWPGSRAVPTPGPFGVLGSTVPPFRPLLVLSNSSDISESSM